MEALAAVGLVSNVLQLIECGYKVVWMAKELHESHQDSIKSNSNTAFFGAGNARTQHESYERLAII